MRTQKQQFARLLSLHKNSVAASKSTFCGSHAVFDSISGNKEHLSILLPNSFLGTQGEKSDYDRSCDCKNDCNKGTVNAGGDG